MILAPVAKWLFGGLLLSALKPRAGESTATSSPLDTRELDALTTAPVSSASSSSSTASVPVGPSSSADANAAYLTESEVDRLLAPRPLPTPASSASSASSAASTASVPVGTDDAAREALARETLAREALASSASSVPTLTGDVLDSPETAARRLHKIATTTTAAQRGPLRDTIRALQAIIGVAADGLIGRQTAARVRELTGLVIPA